MGNKNTLWRLNRFIISTTRRRKMVEGIRLSEQHYDELLVEYAIRGIDTSKGVYFHGVRIYRK